MSRYREPPPPSSPHITAAGAARLKAEYDELWRVRRPEVVRALAAAAAEGDRSENAEYIYRKKELREIDRRLKFLLLRLPVLKVVDALPSDPDRVWFGAWVTVANAGGESSRHRIVGPDEIDAARSCISIDSPLARALLRKARGDSVTVLLPSGEQTFELIDIRYETTASDSPD